MPDGVVGVDVEPSGKPELDVCAETELKHGLEKQTVVQRDRRPVDVQNHGQQWPYVMAEENREPEGHHLQKRLPPVRHVFDLQQQLELRCGIQVRAQESVKSAILYDLHDFSYACAVGVVDNSCFFGGQGHLTAHDAVQLADGVLDRVRAVRARHAVDLQRQRLVVVDRVLVLRFQQRGLEPAVHHGLAQPVRRTRVRHSGLFGQKRDLHRPDSVHLFQGICHGVDTGTARHASYGEVGRSDFCGRVLRRYHARSEADVLDGTQHARDERVQECGPAPDVVGFDESGHGPVGGRADICCVVERPGDDLDELFLGDAVGGVARKRRPHVAAEVPLEQQRSNGRAERGACGAERVLDGRDGGLVVLGHGRDQGEERGGQHGRVGAVGDRRQRHDDVGRDRPVGTGGLGAQHEGRQTEHAGRGARQGEVAVLARHLHVVAGPDRRERRQDDRRDETVADLAGVKPVHRRQVHRVVEEHAADVHGAEPVGQRGAENRAVPEQLERQDRVDGGGFYFDEGGERRGKRETKQDRPSGRVELERREQNEQEQRERKTEDPQHVHAPQFLPPRELHPRNRRQVQVEQTQQEAADADRTLHPEHRAPAVPLRNQAAERPARRARAVAQVGEPLVHAALAQRHKIAHRDAAQSIQARGKARQKTADRKAHGGRRGRALETADREHKHTAQNHGLAAKNVRQLAQRLDNGRRQQIGRRDPRKIRNRVQVRRDFRHDRRQNGGVHGRQERERENARENHVQLSLGNKVLVGAVLLGRHGAVAGVELLGELLGDVAGQRGRGVAQERRLRRGHVEQTAHR
ncbi:hypothetical protein KL915_002242 [Ogataea haglerorum]|nr:hypothetical protein KL915_002242 [Ogataea haglerorum]